MWARSNILSYSICKCFAEFLSFFNIIFTFNILKSVWLIDLITILEIKRELVAQCHLLFYFQIICSNRIISIYVYTYIGMLQWTLSNDLWAKRLMRWKYIQWAYSDKRNHCRRINNVVLPVLMNFKPISYVKAMSH